MVKYAVYILYYDEESKNEATKIYGNKPWARLVFNETTEYVEQCTIMGMINKEEEWADLDYVGFLSWKAHTKINIPENFDDLQNALNEGVEFVYLYGMQDLINYQASFDNDDFFTRVKTYHPLFLDIWELLLNEMGYKKEDIFSPFIREFLCSYYFVSTTIFKKFLNFMIEAKNIIENKFNPKLSELVSRHAYYTGQPSETYKAIVGKHYYNYKPFLFERLPAFFLYINKIKKLPYQRLNSIVSIPHNFSKSSNRLVVYVYTGQSSKNFEAFLSFNKSNCIGDVFILLNKSHDNLNAGCASVLDRKNRQGVLEAWSDIILNLAAANKEAYDYYWLLSDSLDHEFFNTDFVKAETYLADIFNFMIILNENEITRSIVLSKPAFEAVCNNFFHFSIQNETTLQQVIYYVIVKSLRNHGLSFGVYNYKTKTIMFKI